MDATPDRNRTIDRGDSPKAGVLIAVRSAALSRLLRHVLGDCPGTEVIDSLDDGLLLPQRAARLAPQLIVAEIGLLGRDIGPRVAEIRAASPASKLVLIAPAVRPLAVRYGADAVVREAALVKRLPRLLQHLASRC